MKKRLIVATRNAHKVEEIREILTEYEVCDLSVVNDPPEVEETGTTFLENATLKAVAISRIVDGLVRSDDSGLEVDGLSGAPGVYSSRYAGEEGNDALNNEKLLNELSGVANRTARFRCVIVLAENGSVITHFSGAAEGSILEEPAGAGGFGYDPLFMPKGHEESYAELGAEVKNQSSHRANALKELKDWRK